MTSEHLHIDEAVWEQSVKSLLPTDRALLQRVRTALPLAADVSRSDVFLVFKVDADLVCVAVHAQPHSMTSLYANSLAGECYPSSERRWLWTAVSGGLRHERIEPEIFEERPEVGQQVYPVVSQDGRPLAAVAVYTNAIERERHLRREVAFQHSLTRFLEMTAAGQVAGTENVPPFREQDAIIFIDHQARYRYLSGQANNTYRRLGYLDDLRGRTLNEVAAGDLQIVQKAWGDQRCVFSEEEVRGRALLRSAIPLSGKPEQSFWERLQPRRQRPPDRYGALLLVRDETEQRQKAKELGVKAMVVKSVHHRVKNNLQILASIMRMQARRTSTDEARHVLQESVARVLSISVIHESLMEGEDQVLNLRDVVRRIIGQIRSDVVDPSRNIRFVIAEADDVFLRTNKATACALVVDELLLNAVKNGFRDRSEGTVWISIADCGDEVMLTLADDGRGLPEDFSLTSSTGLGLDIVCTLVQDDLKGSFELIPRTEGGAQAVVRFPKGANGGA